MTSSNDQEHTRRLAACWNAFLQAGTTEIERIAWRGMRRSYWKRHPPRDYWEWVFRDIYAAERRAAMKAGAMR
jgi:hypothetical protein